MQKMLKNQNKKTLWKAVIYENKPRPKQKAVHRTLQAKNVKNFNK